MAPRGRLIALAALAFGVLGLLPAAVPGLTGTAGALLLLLAVVAAGDAVFSTGRARGVHVSLPDISRLARQRPGELKVTVEAAHPLPGGTCLGLALPNDFYDAPERKALSLPADKPSVQLTWPVTPQERGAYTIATAHLEAPSWLGLWSMRRSQPLDARVRVYPDLSRDRRRLAGLFLNRGQLGWKQQRQLGKGREFEQLREYQPGDGYEDIHWKATARRSHPVTKLYQVERTQEVYAILDTSRLSRRWVAGEEHEPQLERFLVAAHLLMLAAQQQGDRFGTVAFAERVATIIRAGRGATHYATCRDALYRLRPAPVNPDYETLATELRLRLRQRALLVFLTDLDDPVIAEHFAASMRLISRQHLVLVVGLLPPGAAPLFSAGRADTLDAVYEQLRGHYAWHDLRETQRVLHAQGINMTLTDSPTLSLEVVRQYMRVKQRQLL